LFLWCKANDKTENGRRGGNRVKRRIIGQGMKKEGAKKNGREDNGIRKRLQSRLTTHTIYFHGNTFTATLSWQLFHGNSFTATLSDDLI